MNSLGDYGALPALMGGHHFDRALSSLEVHKIGLSELFSLRMRTTHKHCGMFLPTASPSWNLRFHNLHVQFGFGEQDSFFSQSDLFLPPNRTLIFFLLDFFPKVDVYWFS